MLEAIKVEFVISVIVVMFATARVLNEWLRQHLRPTCGEGQLWMFLFLIASTVDAFNPLKNEKPHFCSHEK